MNDDDDEASDRDDPRTFQHEGRGEEVDPAVSADEWVDDDRDQLDEAADLDDPVEAVELSTLWAATEANATGDQTELADAAVPTPPEEAALVDRAGVSPEADELTTGLPPGADLDRISTEDLTEAELASISEGDPETAAILADELERRRGQNRGD